MLLLLHHLILYCSRNGNVFWRRPWMNHHTASPSSEQPDANKKSLDSQRNGRSRQEVFQEVFLDHLSFARDGIAGDLLGWRMNHFGIRWQHSVFSLTCDLANQYFYELPTTHLGQRSCVASIRVDETHRLYWFRLSVDIAYMPHLDRDDKDDTPHLI